MANEFPIVIGDCPKCGGHSFALLEPVKWEEAKAPIKNELYVSKLLFGCSKCGLSKERAIGCQR